MQTHSQVRAYVSTSRDVENSDTIVTDTLSVKGHLALTLFDWGFTPFFIYVFVC